MVFYATFNTITVITQWYLTNSWVSLVSPALDWGSQIFFPKDASVRNLCFNTFDEPVFLSNICSIVCFSQSCFNPLPDDKILAWSKLTQMQTTF